VIASKGFRIADCGLRIFGIVNSRKERSDSLSRIRISGDLTTPKHANGKWPIANGFFKDFIFAAVEDWQLDFEWLRVQHHVKDALSRKELPDLQAVLFLIGIQELGTVQRTFTKEEKQDLMHIAVCTLLTEEGYYTLQGMDGDGWPHFTQVRAVPDQGVKAQERMLKEKVIQYFNLEHNEISDDSQVA
jgi:hypothetical protein